MNDFSNQGRSRRDLKMINQSFGRVKFAADFLTQAAGFLV